MHSTHIGKYFRELPKDSMCSIHFEDGKILPMTVRDLEKLFTAMPVLEMLLVGREGMHEVDVGDSACTLHLNGAYGVDRDQVVELLQAIYGTDEVLHKMIEEEAHTSVLDAATKLGGCDQLERRIHQVQYAYVLATRRKEAITPATDIWNLFQWVTLGPSCHVNPSDIRALSQEVAEMLKQGYEVASKELVGTMMHMYHLRRPRVA